MAYAREKIKARRKSLFKKNQSLETLQTTCEPLQYVEFWGVDDKNLVTTDNIVTEDICSDDEELEENCNESNDVYTDELGHKYSLICIKNNTRYSTFIKT